ncbi:Sybindin-like protein [Syncephalis plumigaleata]|nr:Sybindin-like protein [Syncephalis plumigaleata]
MIYAVYIINKAGGLVFQRDFGDGLNKLSGNDYLILAGTFHGVHAIASKISPIPGSSGIEMIEADTFRIYCFQTLTGIKFLLITDPQHANADQHTRKIYEFYADYAMKNPFHTPEMPVRCELFDQRLAKFIQTVSA